MEMSLSLISLMIVLWAGVVSFASPCFLPVVPVFVGYLAGQPTPTTLAQPVQPNQPTQPGPNQSQPSQSQLTQPGIARRRWSAVGQGLVFMIGFMGVFIAWWALIGLVGWAVGAWHDWLRIGGGIVLVVLGLHTAGWIHIPLLDRVLAAPYRPDRSQKPNLRRSLLLGLAFGAGWTPCIGPILGGVIGLTTTTGSLGSGLVLMVVYSLGLGIPFVLVCAGADLVIKKLTWFVAHRRAIDIVIGLFLIIVGFLMIANLFARLAALVPV